MCGRSQGGIILSRIPCCSSDKELLRRVPGLFPLVRHISFIALCFAAVSVLCGCGGGSVGTGTGEGLATFEGTVVSREGEPVPGVTVSIAENGEEVVTGEDGRFSLSIPTESLDEEVQLQLTSTTIEQQDPNAIEADPTEEILAVVLDEASPPVVVRTVEVAVRIAGACADSFTNDRSIVQSLPIAEGAVCRLEVEVTDGGVPRSDLQFALEYRACENDSSWNPLLIGVTTSIDNPTVGSAEFPFIANHERCVYRVIAPFEAPELSPVIFEITTLFKQGFDTAVLGGGMAEEPVSSADPAAGTPTAGTGMDGSADGDQSGGPGNNEPAPPDAGRGHRGRK